MLMVRIDNRPFLRHQEEDFEYCWRSVRSKAFRTLKNFYVKVCQATERALVNKSVYASKPDQNFLKVKLSGRGGYIIPLG